MPSSDPRVLEETCREIIKLNPKKVLDIGVGFGKWGMLAREYTDIWNYRFYQEEWETIIHGIEIHERYRNPIWNIYDKIMIGNGLEIVKGILNKFESDDAPIVKYNLTTMIDVLEHFEKDAGQDLLDHVMKISDKFLVSYANSEQKGVRDNIHEDHVSTWEDEDFFRFTRKLVCGGPGWGVYLLSN